MNEERMNEWCKEGVKANGEAESGFKQIRQPVSQLLA